MRTAPPAASSSTARPRGGCVLSAPVPLPSQQRSMRRIVRGTQVAPATWCAAHVLLGALQGALGMSLASQVSDTSALVLCFLPPSLRRSPARRSGA